MNHPLSVLKSLSYEYIAPKTSLFVLHFTRATDGLAVISNCTIYPTFDRATEIYYDTNLTKVLQPRNVEIAENSPNHPFDSAIAQ